MSAVAYRSWLKQLFRAPGKRRTFALRRTQPLCLEPLEDRTLLSTFLVVNTGDNGAGQANYGDLRYCITQANATPGANVIDFALPGAGTQTIHLNSALPALTNSATLDGWSQGGDGYAGAPLVELDGSGVPSGSGLIIEASNCVVRGLTVNHFGGYGLVVAANSSSDWVYGCSFGVTADGLHAAPNSAGGVYLGGTNTLLGTNANGINDAAERNIISGNNGYGIVVAGSRNTIAGDLIGLGADGSTALSNSGAGVLVVGAYNTIGGGAAGAGNVISANFGSGILIDGTSAVGNAVAGNLIGTDASGMAARGNSGDGVVVTDGASGNIIGGSAAGERNIISGNRAAGVALGRFTAAGTDNRVLGNSIGVNAQGAAALGNGFEGVLINAGSSGEAIGGSGAGEGNVIAGNGLFGLNIVNAFNNTVQGNFIGVLPDGTTAAGNGLGGVILQFTNLATTGNLIGGTSAGAGNLIAGNAGPGILLTGSAVTGNTLAGNRIGTTANGTPLGNAGAGIRLDAGANKNLIGGDTSGAGNILAFNVKGVVIAGTNSTGNDILGNSIYGNAGPGIDLGDDGVTPNGTPSPGPNNFQPHPVLISAGNGQVAGTLNAAAGTTYRIELFASPASGPAWQGQTFLGSVLVTTDANGFASFTAAITLPAGQVVTATATNTVTGDTSEFSAGPPASVVVVSGSGQHATVDSDFTDPLQVIVRDAYGNALSGVLIAFVAPSTANGSFDNFGVLLAALSGPGGSFGNIAFAVTNAAGVAASPFFHAGTLAGNYTITATVAGLSEGAAFTLTNDPGPARGIVVSAASETTGAASTAVTVRVVDAFGNTVTDYRGTVHFASSDPHATLPANYTFTAADAGVHRFDNLVLRSEGAQTVTVSDGNGLSALATIDVTNAPPQVALAGAGSLIVENTGQSLPLNGSFTDPDSDQWLAIVNYGDGSGTQPLVLTPNHTFTFSHVYQNEGNYTITVEITDGGGASGFASVPIVVFSSGVDTTQIGQGTAPPGGSAVIRAPGVNATLFRDASDPASATASVLVAPVSDSEIERLGGSFLAGTLSKAYDIRSVDLTDRDRMVVTFQYPPGAGVPELQYFDAVSHSFKSVLGSTLQPNSVVIDAVHHTVTLTLDASSSPRLGDLTGTVFVVSIPPAQTAPPAPPPSPSPLPPPPLASAGTSSGASSATLGTTATTATATTPVAFLATSLPSGSPTALASASNIQTSSNSSAANGISAFSPFVLVITSAQPGTFNGEAEAGTEAEPSSSTPSTSDVLPLLNRLPRAPVAEENSTPPDSGPNAVLSPSRAGPPADAGKPEAPKPPAAPPATNRAPPLGFRLHSDTPAAVRLATVTASENAEEASWFDEILDEIFARLTWHDNGREGPNAAVHPALGVLALCAGLASRTARPRKEEEMKDEEVFV